MINKIVERLKEPSSYASFAGVLYGLDGLFNLHGVPEVAGLVANTGEALASNASPQVLVGMVLTGLLGFFMPEKAKN